MSTSRMRAWEQAMLGAATAWAAWSVTLAPLVGVITGDPWLGAASVVLAAAACLLLVAFAPRAFRWLVGVTKETFRALSNEHHIEQRGRVAGERFGYEAARRLAWDNGMPWVDPDGVVTYGPPAPGEGDREIHLNLHVARLEQQPEVTGLVTVDGEPATMPTTPAGWNALVRKSFWATRDRAGS